jgi:uncharacterized SAM-binding protein YcdF (DUF218 family)
MAAVGSGKEDAPGREGDAADGARRGGLLRAVIAAVARLAIAMIVVGAIGFGLFLWRLPSHEIALSAKADAIVVLTGGAARVTDAIELLAAGHGRRLLITGVHPSTRVEEIAKLHPDHEATVRCCVDLDPSARNTLGNAEGTRRWVSERGFRSLIVVTSSYHMPRAMAELEHQLPDIELIAFPVVTDKLRAEPWWESGATMRLVLFEYVKYMFAVGRMGLEPIVGPRRWAKTS